MIVCIPVDRDGQIDPRWGRAARVAIATVQGDAVTGWQEFDVGWDELHDVGTEGGHHARMARFLQEHKVETVLADHLGPDRIPLIANQLVGDPAVVPQLWWPDDRFDVVWVFEPEPGSARSAPGRLGPHLGVLAVDVGSQGLGQGSVQ